MSNLQEKGTKLICDFLKKNDLISVAKLEMNLGLPKSTIAHALTKKRLIPAVHIYDIIYYLVGYGLILFEGYRCEQWKEDGSIFISKKVEDVETIDEGDSFSYLVKEWRSIVSGYEDLDL